MKLVYISAGIGIHVEAIADTFYKLLGDDFCFISTKQPTGKEGIHKFAEMGREYHSKPYNLCVWESEVNEKKAYELIEKADVVIAGGTQFHYFINRVNERKCTFLCNERWFKKPFYLISIRGWKFLFGTLRRIQNENFHFLALGAYCANDAQFLKIFNDRIYQFAYLVPIEKYDVKQLLETKRNKKTRIMWCARFIDWKHPELVVDLAKRLVKNNYFNFEITMVGGNTPLQDKIKRKILKNGLKDYISIIEGLPNSDVRKLMLQSNIFLVTSDRKEGWGAVLNEAMGSGCAVVASNQIGATPVLIKNGVNGLVFKSKSVESLYQNVKLLLDDTGTMEQMAIGAYDTVTSEWSSENVARRFLELSKSILEGNPVVFTSGPCSKALPCNEYLVCL